MLSTTDGINNDIGQRHIIESRCRRKKKLIKTLHVSMLYGGRLFGLFVLYLLGKNDKQVVK